MKNILITSIIIVCVNFSYGQQVNSPLVNSYKEHVLLKKKSADAISINTKNNNAIEIIPESEYLSDTENVTILISLELLSRSVSIPITIHMPDNLPDRIRNSLADVL